MPDAIVVGSGPNGLAAAIVLARAGLAVRVVEAEETVGGGCRSAELTLPGFVHDVCAAIHPLAVASSFLRSVPLEEHGVEWIEPPAALAHPFDDGTAALLVRSVAETAASLGVDAGRYRKLMSPLAARWEEIADDLLAPLRAPGASGCVRALLGSARRSRRARSRAARFAASGRAGCSPGSRRTRCCRSRGCRRRRSARSSGCSRTVRAGRSRAAARRRSQTRWPRTSGRSAARSRRGAGSSRSTSSTAPNGCCST